MITFVLIGAALVAQGQAPVFRSRVDLLQLDVTVLDKDGKPVRGLAKDDFLIVEDKKPQTIEAFTAVDIPERTAPKAVWAKTVAPDVTSNEIDNQRIFVIVMDDARSMGLNDQKIPDPWAVREMKKTVALFFDTLSDTDLVGLVYTNATRDSQNLTQDHARLLKAIQAYPEDGGGMLIPMKGALMDPCLGKKATVGTIQAVVAHLATIPDRRKAVVYFGGELPFAGPVYQQDCILGPWWQQTIEAAQQAHVTINPIDTMGFRKNGNPMENYTSLADVTGGHAIAATSDFAPGIRQIFLENSSYYLMAYQPTNEVENGTFRRLTVSVKGRPDLDVRTRRSYWAPKRKAGDPEPPAPPQLEALAGVLPVSQLSLRATAAPFAAASPASAATVALALGVRQPPFASRTPEQVELLIKAYTVDGDPRGSDSQTISITVPAARADRDQSRYEVLARVDLPKPGKYQLRLSAHSVVADTRGSVYVDVEVPDFKKDAVSLSGVVMNSALASDPAAPARILRDLVPLVPTSERAFATTDVLTALMRVYQGGTDKLSSVPIKTTILDAAGKSVFNKTDTLAADAFGSTRAADYQFRLPLGTLKTGDYLLTFEAAVAKTTAKRDVRFQVR